MCELCKLLELRELLELCRSLLLELRKLLAWRRYVALRSRLPLPLLPQGPINHNGQQNYIYWYVLF
ncbi:hypothetical protein OZL92_19440 [Bacillus sonorensis]|nr:hypothetical protein [Bacillus sonorensis]MCY8025538.1 hypothetical protein [Bacillus sonorensis]MCZ0074395.1 hypothetical protein [Bacillus sonorensis]MCZ0093503.1 hypothetical protein [Bacillus sonorensis]